MIYTTDSALPRAALVSRLFVPYVSIRCFWPHASSPKQTLLSVSHNLHFLVLLCRFLFYLLQTSLQVGLLAAAGTGAARNSAAADVIPTPIHCCYHVHPSPLKALFASSYRPSPLPSSIVSLSPVLAFRLRSSPQSLSPCRTSIQRLPSALHMCGVHTHSTAYDISLGDTPLPVSTRFPRTLSCSLSFSATSTTLCLFVYSAIAHSFYRAPHPSAIVSSPTVVSFAGAWFAPTNRIQRTQPLLGSWQHSSSVDGICRYVHLSTGSWYPVTIGGNAGAVRTEQRLLSPYYCLLSRYLTLQRRRREAITQKRSKTGGALQAVEKWQHTKNAGVLGGRPLWGRTKIGACFATEEPRYTRAPLPLQKSWATRTNGEKNEHLVFLQRPGLRGGQAITRPADAFGWVAEQRARNPLLPLNNKQKKEEATGEDRELWTYNTRGTRRQHVQKSLLRSKETEENRTNNSNINNSDDNGHWWTTLSHQEISDAAADTPEQQDFQHQEKKQQQQQPLGARKDNPPCQQGDTEHEKQHQSISSQGHTKPNWVSDIDKDYTNRSAQDLKEAFQRDAYLPKAQIQEEKTTDAVGELEARAVEDDRRAREDHIDLHGGGLKRFVDTARENDEQRNDLPEVYVQSACLAVAPGRCRGCGALMQCENPRKPAYVPPTLLRGEVLGAERWPSPSEDAARAFGRSGPGKTALNTAAKVGRKAKQQLGPACEQPRRGLGCSAALGDLIEKGSNGDVGSTGTTVTRRAAAANEMRDSPNETANCAFDAAVMDPEKIALAAAGAEGADFRAFAAALAKSLGVSVAEVTRKLSLACEYNEKENDSELEKRNNSTPADAGVGNREEDALRAFVRAQEAGDGSRRIQAKATNTSTDDNSSETRRLMETQKKQEQTPDTEGTETTKETAEWLQTEAATSPQLDLNEENKPHGEETTQHQETTPLASAMGTMPECPRTYIHALQSEGERRSDIIEESREITRQNLGAASGVRWGSVEEEMFWSSSTSREQRREIICQRCHAIKSGKRLDERLRVGFDQDRLLHPDTFRRMVGSLRTKRCIFLLLIDILSPEVLPALATLVGANPLFVGVTKCDLLPGALIGTGRPQKGTTSTAAAENVRKRCVPHSGTVKRFIFDLLMKGGCGLKTLNVTNIFPLSNRSGEGITKLINAVGKEAIRRKRTVYLIGAANAGKTSFLNNLLSRASGSNTISRNGPKAGDKTEMTGAACIVPGTTLDFLPVVINQRWKVVDTPGIFLKGSYYNMLTQEDLQIALPSSSLHRISQDVKENEGIWLGSLARVELLKGRGCFVSSFLSRSLPLYPLKSKGLQNEDLLAAQRWRLSLIAKHAELKPLPPLKPVDFRIHGAGWRNTAADIVICGLGWISITGCGTLFVRLWVPEEGRFLTGEETDVTKACASTQQEMLVSWHPSLNVPSKECPVQRCPNE